MPNHTSPSCRKAPTFSSWAPAIAFALFAGFAASVLASPDEELVRAAAVAVSTDEQDTSAEQFLSGFTSTVVRVKRREIPTYVLAALHLRRDLAARITAAALTVERNNPPAARRSAIALVSRIVRDAIEANRAEAVPIVQAALEVAPNFAECIVVTAIAAAPEQKVAILRAAQLHPTLFAFLRLTRTENGAIPIDTLGALNPASLTLHDNVPTVVSPEQFPARP